MSLNVEKGQRTALGGTKFLVGLGWDTSRGGGDFDLDAFVISTSGGKISLPVEKAVLFYGTDKVNGKPTLFDGGLIHSGDNLTGAGAGDDETIIFDSAKIPTDQDTHLVVCNIYQAVSRKQNFGMVDNAYIRIVDAETKQEILKYDLSEDYSVNTGVIMGKIYMKDGVWRFQAMGEGLKGGPSVADVAEMFK